METSRKEERTTRNLKGTSGQHRQRPADSHQLPTRTRKIYLNMAGVKGIGEIGARAARENTTWGLAGRDVRKVEIFSCAGEANPCSYRTACP